MTFDLEKARDLAANPIHCPETDDVFRKAIAEIERLRGFETAARDLSADLTKVAGERDDLKKQVSVLVEIADRLAARIKELEGALAEYQRLGKTIAGKVPDADECPDDLPPIGSPYRSWQITEERIRAIQWAEEMAGDCKAGDVLRAMLEAGQ